MYRIYRTREKEEGPRQKHKRCQIEKDILSEEGLWRGPTLDITNLENCTQDMKRRSGTILAWYSCHAVSSSTEG
jgi:hypothetical protein